MDNNLPQEPCYFDSDGYRCETGVKHTFVRVEDYDALAARLREAEKDAARYRLYREIGFADESVDAYDADGLDALLDERLAAISAPLRSREMSLTPRTDALRKSWQNVAITQMPACLTDYLTLCRTLERELQASQERAEELESKMNNITGWADGIIACGKCDPCSDTAGWIRAAAARKE